MKKIKEILIGWKNHIFGISDVTFEQVVVNRNNICKECPENSINKTSNYFLRIDEHCTLCGCTLSAKQKSPDTECPLGKWKEFKTINNGREKTN